MNWKELIAADVVLFWPFDTAPKELQELSPHGGDEDWICICSPRMENDDLIYRECGYVDDDGVFHDHVGIEFGRGRQGIGICSTTRHLYEGMIVFIAAHA